MRTVHRLATAMCLLLTGCATGQPPTLLSTQRDQLQKISARVTRAYSQFPWIPAVVIEPGWPVAHSTYLQISLGSAWLAGTSPTPTPPLTPSGAALFAHELGHAMLHHHFAAECRSLSTRYACEMAANVEAVRISVIAWGLSQAQAIALVDAYLRAAVEGQLAGERMNMHISAPGHKHACIEARDFRARFPAEVAALPALPAGCAAITE